MKDDRGDGVALLAITLGGAAGLFLATILLAPSQEPAAGSFAEPASTSPALIDVTVEVPEAVEGASPAEPDGWTDPRGPERGPTQLEWEVIGVYKTIESMTATEPSADVVDETLLRLWRYADEHGDNPYIQELYLKGLRVARYYAVEAGDHARGVLLAARFEDHAEQHAGYELVRRELQWMNEQLEGQSAR